MPFCSCVGLRTAVALVGVAVMVAPASAFAVEPSQPGVDSGDGKEQRNPKLAAYVIVHKVQSRILEDKPAKFDKVEFTDFLRTQLSLLRSRKVINTALRSMEVSNLASVKQQMEPAEWLEKRLQVTADQKTGIIRIEVAGGTSQERALLANAVTTAYIAEFVDKEYVGKLSRLDLLKELHAQYELGLKKKRDDLRKFEGMEANLLKLKQEFALKEIANLQQELLEVQSQVRKVQVDLEIIKAKEKAKGPDAPLVPKDIEDALSKHPAVKQLTEEIGNLETALMVIRQLVANPEKDQTFLKARERLDLAKKGLGDLREQLNGSIAKQVRERRQANLSANRMATETRVDFLTRLAEILTKEIHDRQSKAAELGKKWVDLAWLKSDIDALDETQKKIGRQIQLLQIEIQAPRRVMMLDEAVAPTK